MLGEGTVVSPLWRAGYFISYVGWLVGGLEVGERERGRKGEQIHSILDAMRCDAMRCDAWRCGVEHRLCVVGPSFGSRFVCFCPMAASFARVRCGVERPARSMAPLSVRDH